MWMLMQRTTVNTTNLNDVATKTNWLDGGGVDPLLSFINGTTDSPQITPGSNQEYDIIYSAVVRM